MRPLLVADARAIRARGRDHPDDRLVARPGTTVQHVVDRAGLVRVQLVHHRAVDVQPVQRRAFRRQRPQDRGDVRHRQVVLEHPHPQRTAHRRGPLGHPLRVVERDARLVLRGRGRVHLGTRLIVGREQVQQQAARHGRLPVLARHLDVGPAVPAQACPRVHPAEDRRQDEALPRLEPDQLARPRPLPLQVRQARDELARPRGGVGVELPREAVARLAREVLLLALARPDHPLARRDRARQHAAAVAVGGLDERVHPARNLPQPESADSMPGSDGWFIDGDTRARADGDRPNSARYRFTSSRKPRSSCACTDCCR